MTRLYAAFIFPRDIIVSNSISLLKFTSTSDSCDMPITVCTPAYSSDSVLSVCRQPFVFCISSVIGSSFTALVYIRFCPSPNVPIFFFRVLWLLLTSWCIETESIPRPPQVRAYSFLRFLRHLPNMVCWSRALQRCACLPTSFSLLCGFCSSDQMFAAGFLQIPPHDEHPCPWLYASRH